MRLLYDFYSSRRNAQLTLLAADCLTFSSALLFASGVSARSDWPRDLPFILLWSLIPRGAATYLDWLGRPRDFVRSLLASTLLVLAIAALVFCGWEMVREAAPAALRPRLGTAVVIILAWVSGFLLCVPRAYRLSDFSLTSAVLLGLLDRAPLPFLFVPLFLLGLTLSSATRRLVHDVLPGERRERFNLQNARAVSILATALGAALFSLGLLGLRPLLDDRAPPGGRPGAFSGAFFRGSETRRPSPSGRSGVPRRSRERSFTGADVTSRETSSSGRTIGYTHELALRDLSRPRFDRSLVLAARLIDEDGKEVTDPPPSWKPETFLWRGIRFSRFDAETSAWVEDTDYERLAWPEGGAIPLFPAEKGPPELRLEVIVLLPVFRNLVAPYFATELGPLDPPPATGFYETDAFGHIFPTPGDLRRGVRYRMRFTPWPALLGPLPDAAAEGTHPDRVYLEFPPRSEVGVDLAGLAATIDIDRGPVRERIRRLEAFYGEGFRYDDRAFWSGGGHRLGVFLLRERLGDCTYFATSAALLLRAGGVSTRAVVGFLGSELEALHPGRAYVRNMSAHSWIEVYFPGAGWYPIDPTRWVEPSLTYSLPPLPTGEEEPEPLVAFEDEESLAFESAEESPQGFEATPWRRRRFEGPFGPAGAAEPAPEDGDVFSIRPGPAGPSDRDLHAWVGSRRGGGSSSGGIAGGSAGGGGVAGNAEEPEEDAESDEGEGWSRARTGLARAALVLFSLLAAGLLLLTLFRPKRDEDEEERKDEDDEEDELSALAARGRNSTEWEPQSPSEEILFLYHRLQLELALTRNHRLPHQTPLEHGSRFRGGDESLDKAFAKLHHSVYSVLYGDGVASPEEVKQARLCCRRIRKLLG